MKSYSIINIIFAIALTGLFSCSGNKEGEQEETTDHKLIELTQEQFDVNDMKLGKVTSQEFKKKVECNGYIKASPTGTAMLSPRIGGIVSKINVIAGDMVKRGEVLCELTSNEFIILQRDFAETSANLKQLESEYKRSKSLYEKKITSEKNYIAIESAYLSMLSRHKALKMQLQLLNLDASKVKKGNFYPTYPIKTSIPGRVSDVYVRLGSYVEPQQKLMEVVNENTLQLKLSIFENDISFLKPGQKVEFYTINNRDSVYKAVLSNISNTINEDTKTITCLANISNEKSGFVNNSFIRADIIVDEQEMPALPSGALIKSKSNYYVLNLVKKEGDTYFFKKVKVNTGHISKEFTEIINHEDLSEVLVKGVYNLNVN